VRADEAGGAIVMVRHVGHEDTRLSCQTSALDLLLEGRPAWKSILAREYELCVVQGERRVTELAIGSASESQVMRAEPL